MQSILVRVFKHPLYSIGVPFLPFAAGESLFPDLGCSLGSQFLLPSHDEIAKLRTVADERLRGFVWSRSIGGVHGIVVLGRVSPDSSSIPTVRSIIPCIGAKPLLLRPSWLIDDVVAHQCAIGNGVPVGRLQQFLDRFESEVPPAIRRGDDALLDYWMKNPSRYEFSGLSAGVELRWRALLASAKAAAFAIEGDQGTRSDSRQLLEMALSTTEDYLREAGIFCHHSSPGPVFLVREPGLPGMESLVAISESTDEGFRWAAILWTWHWLTKVRGVGTSKNSAPVGFAVRGSEGHVGRGGCGSFVLTKLPLTLDPERGALPRVYALLEAPWSWPFSVDRSMAEAIRDASGAASTELGRTDEKHGAFSWHFQNVELANAAGNANRERVLCGNLGGASLGAAVAGLIALTSKGESYDAGALVSATCDREGNLGPVEGVETKLYSVLQIGAPIKRVIVHPACVPAGTTLESERLLPMGEGDCTLRGLLDTLRVGANLVQSWQKHLEELWTKKHDDDPPYLRGLSRAQLFIEPGFRSLRMKSEERGRTARHRRSWTSDDPPRSFGSEILPDGFEVAGSASSSDARSFTTWKDVSDNISSSRSRCVIVAPSGYGKTLFALNASLKLDSDIVPIPVNLSSLLPVIGGNTQKALVRATMETRLSPSLPSFAEIAQYEDHARLGEELEKAIQDGRACIFLDGLDEVAASAEAYALVNTLSITSSRVVVLTREYGLSRELLQSLSGSPDRVSIHHIQPLTQGGMNDFLQKYFVDLEKAETLLSHLSSVLIQNPALEEVTASPLLLTFASYLALQEKTQKLDGGERTFRLSETTTVSQLYEEIALLVLENIHAMGSSSITSASASEPGQDALEMLDLLSQGCLDAFVLNPKRNRVSEGEIIAGDVPSDGEYKNRRHLKMIQDGISRTLTRIKSSGLLIQVRDSGEARYGRVFAFAHRSFLEYLAARAWVNLLIGMSCNTGVLEGGQHYIQFDERGLEVAETLEQASDGSPAFRRARLLPFQLLLLATQNESWSNCLGMIMEQLKEQAAGSKSANFMAGLLRYYVRNILDAPNRPTGRVLFPIEQGAFIELRPTESCWSVLRSIDPGLLCAFAKANYSSAALELARLPASKDLAEIVLELINRGAPELSDSAAKGARSSGKAAGRLPEYQNGLREALKQENENVRRSVLLALEWFSDADLLEGDWLQELLPLGKEGWRISDIAIPLLGRIYVGSEQEEDAVNALVDVVRNHNWRPAVNALEKLGRKLYSYQVALSAIKERFEIDYHDRGLRRLPEAVELHSELCRRGAFVEPSLVAYMFRALRGGSGTYEDRKFISHAIDRYPDLIEFVIAATDSPLRDDQVWGLEVLGEVPTVARQISGLFSRVRSSVAETPGDCDEERSVIWQGCRALVRLQSHCSDIATLDALLIEFATDPNVHIRHAVAGILRDIAEEAGVFLYWDVLEKLLNDDDWGTLHVGVSHILSELGEQVADHPRILSKLYKLLPAEGMSLDSFSGPRSVDFDDGTDEEVHRFCNAAGMIGRLGPETARRCPALLDALVVFLKSPSGATRGNAEISVEHLGEVVWAHDKLKQSLIEGGKIGTIVGILGPKLLDEPAILKWAVEACELSTLARVGNRLLAVPGFEQRVFRELSSDHSLRAWEALEEIGVPITWVAARLVRAGTDGEAAGDEESPSAE